MSDCIFCGIVNNSSNKILEYNDIIVIPDLYPQADYHYLIIPKTHIESLLVSSDEHTELLGRMLLATKDLASLKSLVGYKTLINTGVSGGQEIFHIHIHFLANRKE